MELSKTEKTKSVNSIYTTTSVSNTQGLGLLLTVNNVDDKEVQTLILLLNINKEHEQLYKI